MDWTNIMQQVFTVCIIPLLGLGTAMLVAFVRAKIANDKKTADSNITVKYLDLLENTIVDCIVATNQTYVEALKEQNSFTQEAQAIALEKTMNAVKDVLSEDAKIYITNFVGDLDTYIKEKIEANIENVKQQK